MSSNLHVIGDIAANQSTSDGLGVEFGGNASDAMSKALAKQRENDQEALGAALVVLLGKVRQSKQTHVTNIRSYRQHVENEKKKLADIDRAIAYGNETGNYVPIANLVGCRVSGNLTYEEQVSLGKIPDDWQPSSED